MQDVETDWRMAELGSNLALIDVSGCHSRWHSLLVVQAIIAVHRIRKKTDRDLYGNAGLLQSAVIGASIDGYYGFS